MDARLNEIHAQVMGEVQIEILKTMIQERYGISVEFGSGNIVYKETIEAPVEGTDILNLYAIMQKYICFWSLENREAAWNLPLPAVRICWIKTGRD